MRAIGPVCRRRTGARRPASGAHAAVRILFILLLGMTYTTPTAAQVIPITRVNAEVDTVQLRLKIVALRDSLDNAAIAAQSPRQIARMQALTAEMQGEVCAEKLTGLDTVTADETACLFDSGAFSETNLTFYTRGGSVYSDLFATTFGQRIRVAVAALLSETNEADSTQAEREVGETREAVQQLIAGGGNVVVSALLPLAVGVRGPRNASLALWTGGRIGVETQALGANVDEVPYHAAGLIAANGHWGSDDRLMQFFGSARFELIAGNTALEQLQADGPGKVLQYIDLSGGVLVGNLFAITLKRIATGTSALRSAETQISITTVRGAQ